MPAYCSFRSEPLDDESSVSHGLFFTIVTSPANVDY